MTLGAHTVRMLLAKNPAGWQEALSMVDTDAGSVVISVNGQVPDGEDLSWLWDVNFEHFVDHPVVAAGERGTDLAVRLGYAGVEHTLVHDAVEAIASCPPGHVEVVANYTAFLSSEPRVGQGRPCADSTVRIGLVLPDVMGTYGDGGNSVVLRQRLRRRGFDAEVVEITLADPVPSDAGSVHARRRRGLRAAARDQAPDPLSRPAGGGGRGCAGAGDLRGDPGARTLV